MSSGIEIRAIEKPPMPWGDEVVFKEILVPLLFFPKVAVRREEKVELGKLDLFLVEAALRLKEISPSDLAEIAGLSQISSMMWIRKLSSLGLLEQVSEMSQRYKPVEKAAKRALKKGAAYKEVPDTLSLIYALDVDEVYVAAGNRAYMLDKLKTAGNKPLPDELMGKRPVDLLREKMRAKAIHGLEMRVTKLLKKGIDWQFEEVCPAYRLQGIAYPNGTLELRFFQEDSRSSSHRDRESDTADLVCLREAGSLIERYDISNNVGEELKKTRVWRSLEFGGETPSEVHQDRNILSCRVSKKTLSKVASERLVTERLGVEVRSSESRIEMAIKLLPARSKISQEMYLIDAVVQRLRPKLARAREESVLQVADEIVSDCDFLNRVGKLDLTEKDIAERAWQLGLYSLIYAMREKRDFNYA